MFTNLFWKEIKKKKEKKKNNEKGDTRSPIYLKTVISNHHFMAIIVI